MTTLPRGRGLVIDDLEFMPEDGNRYELIDGVLLVSPAPSVRHQRMALLLAVRLEDVAPPNVMVLTAPTDVELDERSMVEPDVLVGSRQAFTERRLVGPPLLAVEVLSPSTRLADLNIKFDRYQRAGVGAYWVLDPMEPRLIAWELVDGNFVEVADVAGTDSFAATRPFDVVITPADLVD